MKRLFTLLVVLSIAVSGFAQNKVASLKFNDVKPAQEMTFTGMEDVNAIVPEQARSIMSAPSETELSPTYYDWQSNMGARNFTAVWPDGYAVVAYTFSLEEGSMNDRGTGLSIYDPATGEWSYTEGRVESDRTGFGSIARYGENGLVVAAHTSTAVGIYINEDFRNGGEWSEPIYVGAASGGAWPVVSCSGENNDIIHVLYNMGQDTELNGVLEATLYARVANGVVEEEDLQLELLSSAYASELGSNSTYFMPWDPEKPNRVSFIVNAAWSDGRLVISEDNGATWSQRVFYKHHGINTTVTDNWFFYPRWTSAAFDKDDNLCLVYEYNGSTGAPGEDSYYPVIGGVAYWSEVLPKNELCLGGVGNAGEPFILDSTYMIQDLYLSEWYWSNALHEPLPEYFGVIEGVDSDGNVLPRDYSGDDWNVPTAGEGGWDLHGVYNCGKSAFASMVYDKDLDMVVSVWSQICGNEEGLFFDGVNHTFRLFCNISLDGGMTWEGTKAVLTDFVNQYDEMVYPVIIPHIYSDADGRYIQVAYQNDQNAGTFVQGDESEYDNNYYRVVRIDLDYISEGANVEEMIVSPVQMNVYPNPATSGEITVMVNSKSEVSIYNAVGQLVDAYTVDGAATINVSEYASGIYFIKADNGNEVTTQKVVVK